MSDMSTDMLRRMQADAARLRQTETRETPGNVPGFTSFYDVGTFTPVLQGTTIAGTFTYDAANTHVEWSRIGNRVMLNGRLRITAIAVAPTGNLQIITLPFTPLASAGSIAGGVGLVYTGITLTAGHTQLQGDILSGAAAIRLFEVGSNIAAASVVGGALVLVGGVADFRFSGHFQV